MDGLSAVFSSEGNIEQEQLDYSKLGPGDRVDQLGSAIRIPFETAGGTDMAAAALKYVGDDPNLYQVFFDSAVFDITPADRESLIQAIRMLNENPKEVVDYNRVIPYFVVHNFVDNYDGYTGIFDHNYYLREANGKLSMIPWDYNLAFGVFTIESAGGSLLGTNYGGHMDKLFGNAMDDKTNMVNYPIDTPTFTVSTEDRPLLAAILNDPEVLERYHEVFRAFLDDLFASGKFESIYTQAWNNIAPYIENGRTFYTYDQFVTASKAIHDFCILRSESVRRQLDGTLPATMEGQSRDYKNLVDASNLKLASSVTFDGMLMGITSQDVTQILDAITGEHPQTMEGVAEALTELAENPKTIPSVIGRVIASSPFLQKVISSVIGGPILLVLSILVLVIARKKTICYHRRRR